MEAWAAGLKGITTYRLNAVLGSVLSVEAEMPQGSRPDRARPADPDQRRAPVARLRPCAGRTGRA